MINTISINCLVVTAAMAVTVAVFKVTFVLPNMAVFKVAVITFKVKAAGISVLYLVNDLLQYN